MVSGTAIDMDGKSFGGFGEIGLGIAFSNQVGIKITGAYYILPTVEEWEFTAKGTKPGEEEEKTVTLSKENFKNLTDINPLNLSGVAGQAALYYRF